MSTVLLDLLACELAVFHAFGELLDQETRILSGELSTPDLLALIDRKSAMIEELRQLGKIRDTWLTDNGYASGIAGMQAASSQCEEIRRAWGDFCRTVSQAADINLANGALIASQLADTQTRLNTLRRLQTEETNVYDARGRPQARGVARSLGEG